MIAGVSASFAGWNFVAGVECAANPSAARFRIAARQLLATGKNRGLDLNFLGFAPLPRERYKLYHRRVH
jgi:hypothetical protein